jgi:hypothetical protein
VKDLNEITAKEIKKVVSNQIQVCSIPPSQQKITWVSNEIKLQNQN